MIVIMQKNYIGHTIATQKIIIQTDPSDTRYGQKRDGFICAKQNQHVLNYISGLGGRFESLCFALTAASSAYSQPYVFDL